MAKEEDVRPAVTAWLEAAVLDARRRGVPEIVPLLQGLAESTVTLRTAAWNDEAVPAVLPLDGALPPDGAIGPGRGER
jgi:hypothetical protein